MMFQGKAPWKVPEKSYPWTSLMVQNVYEKLTIWLVAVVGIVRRISRIDVAQ